MGNSEGNQVGNDPTHLAMSADEQQLQSNDCTLEPRWDISPEE